MLLCLFLSVSGKSRPTHHSTFFHPSHASFITGPTVSSSTGLTLPYTNSASYITVPAATSPSGSAHTLSTTDPTLFNTDFASSVNGLTVTSLIKGPAPSHRTLNRTNGRQVTDPVTAPPTRPRGRQEVLRPVLISFPPSQFPSLCPASSSVRIKTPVLSQTWRTWSRPVPQTHIRFGSSMRPWLWGTPHPPTHTQICTLVRTLTLDSLMRTAKSIAFISSGVFSQWLNLTFSFCIIIITRFILYTCC